MHLHHDREADAAATVTDPVCGMKVDLDKATARLHEGDVIYFCSPGCAAAFDANPRRYGHSG